MDLEEFRVILSKLRADVWMIIDAAIAGASSDYGEELKDRRDRIIKKLYAMSSPIYRNCDVNDRVTLCFGEAFTCHRIDVMLN